MPQPVISIAQYRVRAGAEEDFEDVLRLHQRALRELELVTDRPFETFLGEERGIGGPWFVEIFEWADPMAAQAAHTHPRISAAWETIGALCQARGDRPMFEFHSGRPLDLS
ncbi:MAG: hypothetical protein M3400_12095 [Actinomycetota bacterium]|nr:hypothetical protein [Actinomycetota bacterium]